MLDMMNAPVATTPWADTLQRGDVVMFRFPCADDGPVKPRPCLVVEIVRIGDDTFVELAYGTTAQTRANRGYGVHIYTPIGMALAGLRQPTRFVCARRVIVNANNRDFATKRLDPSPVIGRLDNAGIERMNAVRARIHAEHDIAADRRETERTEQAMKADKIPVPRAPASATRAAALATARRRAAEAAGRRVAR